MQYITDHVVLQEALDHSGVVPTSSVHKRGDPTAVPGVCLVATLIQQQLDCLQPPVESCQSEGENPRGNVLQ